MDPPWKGSDSDSTDVSEIKETYDAENLLAEKFDSGSRVKKYLVKWQDYPIDRCTWEPAENLPAFYLTNWEDTKIRIRNGFQDPFDWKAWDKNHVKSEADKLSRHLRRYKKRRSKRLPIGKMQYLEIDGHIDQGDLSDSEASEDDHPLAQRYKAKKRGEDQTVAGAETEDSDDDRPLSRRQKRGESENDEKLIRRRKHVGSEADDQPLSQRRKLSGSGNDGLPARHRKRSSVGKSKQLTSPLQRMQLSEDGLDDLFLPSSPQIPLEADVAMNDDLQELTSIPDCSNTSLDTNDLLLSKTPLVPSASTAAPKSVAKVSTTSVAQTNKVTSSPQPSQVSGNRVSASRVPSNATTHSRISVSKKVSKVGRDVLMLRISIPKESRLSTEGNLATASSTTPISGAAKSKAPTHARTASATGSFPLASPKERQGPRTAPPITDPMKNWGAPPAQTKRNMQPRLYGNISAIRRAELAARNERPLPSENYDLYNPSTKEVVQHAKPIELPTKPLSVAKIANVSKNWKTSQSIATHSKFPRSIPLTCPYWKEGAQCPSEPDCFFLHEDKTRTASYRLFEQAEEESQKTGGFQYRFGFSGPLKICEYWLRGGCTRPDDECWHAHWMSDLASKIQMTCWFFATAVCRRPAEKCSYLHEMTDKIAPPPHSVGEQKATCIPWEQGNCPFSASECPLLHQKSGKTVTYTREYTASKVQQTCLYWKRGFCRLSAEQCKFLHMETDKVASPPTSQTILRNLNKATAANKIPLVNKPHTQPAQAVATRNHDFNPDETRFEEAYPPQETSTPTQALAKPAKPITVVETPCRLNFLGFVVEILMDLPTHVQKTLMEEGQLSLQLVDWALAEHLEFWAGLDKSKALADGPVVCKSVSVGLDALKTHLRMNLTGGVVCLPSIVIVFFPGPMDDWRFLQPSARSECQFYFHIALSGNFVRPTVSQLVGPTTSLEYLNTRLKMKPDDFFLCKNNEIATRRRVFILANEAWAAEKEILTRYFRESDAEVHSNWLAFKSSKTTGTITGQNLRGVIVIHPEFQLAEIQNIPEFREVLFRSFNLFRMGTSLDKKEFVCEWLFTHGSCIYISNEMYEDHPEDALNIIKGLVDQNKRRTVQERTWRLAARPKLGRWLSNLHSEKKDDKAEARALLWLAIEEFEQPSIVGKLIVDLGEQETQQLDDDFMIERFALWSIMNAASCRRFIVIVPDRKLEWERKYQHLSFMGFADYTNIFFPSKK